MNTLDQLGRIEVPGETASVSVARGWARELLHGRIPTMVLHDVVLLLSETVTNALVHSDSGTEPGGRVTVAVSRSADEIRVEVTDEGSATRESTVQVSDLHSDRGRGLLLVDSLATAWGTHRDGAKRVVWFQTGNGRSA